MPGTLLRASKIQTCSVGSPFWKKMTFALTPWLYGVNVPRGNRSTVCKLQSCISISNTSPALPSNRQLSGSTIAARPPFFSVLTTCWTKFSCLLLVSIVKSSRVGRLIGSLGSERWIGQHAVELLAGWRVVDGVAKCDVWFDAVQVQVH